MLQSILNYFLCELLEILFFINISFVVRTNFFPMYFWVQAAGTFVESFVFNETDIYFTWPSLTVCVRVIWYSLCFHDYIKFHPTIRCNLKLLICIHELLISFQSRRCVEIINVANTLGFLFPRSFDTRKCFRHFLFRWDDNLSAVVTEK